MSKSQFNTSQLGNTQLRFRTIMIRNNTKMTFLLTQSNLKKKSSIRQVFPIVYFEIF
jgi:hypothetical protein